MLIPIILAMLADDLFPPVPVVRGEVAWVTATCLAVEDERTGERVTVFFERPNGTPLQFYVPGKRPIKIDPATLQVGRRIAVTGVVVLVEPTHEPADGMAFAVECWVADQAGWQRAARVLPAEQHAEVLALGAACYQVRQQAHAALAERGESALSTLAWARRHPDPEIRLRAGLLLDRLGYEDVKR